MVVVGLTAASPLLQDTMKTDGTGVRSGAPPVDEILWLCD